MCQNSKGQNGHEIPYTILPSMLLLCSWSFSSLQGYLSLLCFWSRYFLLGFRFFVLFCENLDKIEEGNGSCCHLLIYVRSYFVCWDRFGYIFWRLWFFLGAFCWFWLSGFILNSSKLFKRYTIQFSFLFSFFLLTYVYFIIFFFEISFSYNVISSNHLCNIRTNNKKIFWNWKWNIA